MQEIGTTKMSLPFPKTGALILGVILVFLVLGHFGLNLLSARTLTDLERLNRENKSLEDYFKGGVSGEANIRSLSQVLHLGELIKSHAYPAQFLTQLEQNLPKNVIIDSLTVDFSNSNLILLLTVNDVGGFAGAVEALKTSSFFIDPQIELQTVDFQKNSVVFKLKSGFVK